MLRSPGQTGGDRKAMMASDWPCSLTAPLLAGPGGMRSHVWMPPSFSSPKHRPSGMQGAPARHAPRPPPARQQLLELSGALARDSYVSVTDSSSSLVVSQNEANENKPKRAGPSETSRVGGGGGGGLASSLPGWLSGGRSRMLTVPGWWMKPGPALPAPPKPTPPWPGGVLLQVGTKPQGS